MNGEDGNKWVTPQTVLAALGFLSAIGAAWMAFDARITRTEVAAAANETRIDQADATTSQRFDRIEAKLDRLIERR